MHDDPDPDPDDEEKKIVPAVIPVQPVPLAKAPENSQYTIVNRDVPLGILPATGGKSAMYGLFGLLSLIGGFLFGKEKKDDGDQQ